MRIALFAFLVTITVGLTITSCGDSSPQPTNAPPAGAKITIKGAAQ